MGRASAGDIFDRVALELIAWNASDEVKLHVCDALICELCDGDWDTVEDHMGKYRDEPAIMQAFADNGYHPDEDMERECPSMPC